MFRKLSFDIHLNNFEVGDEASLTSLIEKAAEVNETSPESMRELFKNIFHNKYFFSNRVP